ncbi:ATP-binding protein [Minwuia sp.]|uniref:PAS domain-containing sensor histidine kinase n=1 Tax=Minwuia sp. TaxID=2493630 RepID=UPI003A929E14
MSDYRARSLRRLPLAALTTSILLTASGALAQEAADPSLKDWAVPALIGGVIIALLAVRLVMVSSRSGRLKARLETAESSTAESTREIEKLKAEQALLRDKIDSLGRERDSYRALLNDAPIAAWRRESGGAVIWRNRTLDRILGPDAASDEIAARADQDRPIRLVEKARASGETVSEERRFVVDGQRRTYMIHETPPHADGTSAGYAIDISAVDEVRHELRRHIEANNGIFENISTAVAVYDRDKKLIFCNNAFKQLWGLDDAFIASIPTIGEVLDRLKEMRKLPEEIEFRQFRKGREALFNALLDPMEELYQRPDERMVRVTVTRHGFGGLMFLFDDATDHIIMERNLNTYIAVQRATLDNLYEAVAVFGPDGRLSLNNTPYRNMWGLPAEFTEGQPHARELIDRVIATMGGTPDLLELRDALIASVTDPRASSSRIELPDGRIIDTTAMTLPDAQKLFTYLDVTDSLQIERALRERNEALVAGDMVKSEFLENMSYELRTPLNTILGFAEILQNDYFGQLNDRQREYASGILEASEQFLSMINDMLDLASIQAGHMQVNREQIDVATLIEDVQEKHRERATRRKIGLSSEIGPDIKPLEGDRRRVDQVLGNLLSNAVKFTPPGGQITIGANASPDGADLWVQDTGIGIPEEEKERVFETFRTSERHTRRGTGLGLALVRNLMELHGGSVELESEVGKGTRVTCHFPHEMPEELDALTIRVDGVTVEPVGP